MSKSEHKSRTSNLDEKAMDAFDEAFEAMAQWRDDINELTEKHGDAAFQKLTVAARAVGWPDSVIESTKMQLTQASKMQSDMIDHMMTAWQEHLKAPASPAKLMGTISSNPLRQAGANPDLTNFALAPTQFWMQATAMWQKSWTDAMQAWMGNNKQNDDNDKSNSR
jgi:hypothetical protein